MTVKTFDQKIEDFIDSLDRDTYSKVLMTSGLLKIFGNQLSMPYSKSLGNRLFEMRVRGQQEVRIFYTFYQEEAVLLHGFNKKTQKTPLKELETAMGKLKILTNR